MSYSCIKKAFAIAMLVAFTTPSTLALSENFAPYRSIMNFSGGVTLTQSNDNITLSLRDSDVKQVLRMFADKAGMNIVFHESVGGKVTLDLVETPVNDAFNIVLQVSGLNYYKQGNTMVVIKKDHADNAAYSKQEMLVFPIQYVNAGKIADFLNKNVFGMKKIGMSSVEAATVNSATNELIVFGMPNDVAIIEKVIAQLDREPLSRTIAVNHTTPAEMANAICNVFLPARGINTSSESESSDSGSGASSGGDSAEGAMTGGAADASGGDSSGGSSAGTLKLGEGVVACSVSNTSSSKDLTPFNVQNLSVTYFPQRGTIALTGGSEAQIAMIEKYIKDNDIKQPQAMLEIQIVELNEAGSKEFTNEWHLIYKGLQAHFDGHSFSGGRKGYLDNTIPVTMYGEPVPTIDDRGNITGMTEPTWTQHIVPNFSTPRISWYMNYLIENGKGRVLANPKIMITNGKTSKIDIVQDYVEKVTSEYTSSSMGSGLSSGIVERTYNISDDLGIKVELTPFISPDGYVTLNIKPNYSTIADQVNVARTLENGQTVNDLVATLLNKRNLELNNLRIKDGETLVIGGLIQESETKTVAKIPFLGDLPVVGAIFRSTATKKSKNELVIMITPKIIADNEDV